VAFAKKFLSRNPDAHLEAHLEAETLLASEKAIIRLPRKSRRNICGDHALSHHP